MKKIFLMTVYVTVIVTFFSCSKDKDQYLSTAGNVNTSAVDQYGHKVIANVTPENRGASLGGGDDDKPIIMHRIVSSEFGRLQDAKVIMMNDADSIQLFTNAAGECTFELPYAGTWEMKVALTGFSFVDTYVNVTDSFSVRTTYLDHQ